MDRILLKWPQGLVAMPSMFPQNINAHDKLNGFHGKQRFGNYPYWKYTINNNYSVGIFFKFKCHGYPTNKYKLSIL